MTDLCEHERNGSNLDSRGQAEAPETGLGPHHTAARVAPSKRRDDTK